MAAQAEHGHVGLQRHDLFGADAGFRRLANQRHVGRLGVALDQLRPGIRILLLQFALPADHARDRVLAVQQRHREHEAAFAQQHTLRVIRHGNDPARQIGELTSLGGRPGAKQGGGGEGRAQERERTHRKILGCAVAHGLAGNANHSYRRAVSDKPSQEFVKTGRAGAHTYNVRLISPYRLAPCAF
ncbi:hypothetical protein D3C72_1574840 [compost metagenome]